MHNSAQYGSVNRQQSRVRHLDIEALCSSAGTLQLI